MWSQRELTLEARARGFHLVTEEVTGALPELGRLAVGLLHVHVCHTSASITINENAAAAVRRDLRSWFDAAVPEDSPMWTHRDEGPDDMPAHVKASLLGSSVTVPVSGGRLVLGTWQGIYLGEHRDAGGPRRLVLTAWGEESAAGHG
jgi:secondary thiamine-phosphate synthase enzyme